MDDPTSPFLNCTYFHQDKNMDELMKQSLVLNMELEDTRLRAQEEIKSRDHQITQLKSLLTTAIQQTDEAQHNFQKALFEKLLLQQQLQQNSTHSGISTIEDETKMGIDSNNNGFTSSDCDESIVSSPLPQEDFSILLNKPLPQKGKLLEAVVKAGPMLKTLLLAGPLPRWHHPPPLNAYQIPPSPVVIPSTLHLNNFFWEDGSS